ncbi:hypothetical protein GTA08_BOTSDO05018 [Neofusicoccum parvum]|uniref:Uncharacterized protein n=3 Tax=Neofusicoccum TaxID=407951 RepID=R1GA49_BOTPV|nr:hypothetical protein UCRNP2_4829 [Neofusicoccum parvum UCRNP2]GME24994.1 hypothetical protein GTA08_BOTSDO05018 [Neofusicoccum parvum]GME32493.1 hypothetical protein GTA08_BOTSDO05018 [Neofusicoccum parvum]
MAASKFIEVLDTTTQPTYSGYNVSLEDILAETQRRSSTGDIDGSNNPSSKPRNNSNSGASSTSSTSSSPDSSTPTSPTSPTMRNRLRRFTLGNGGGAKHR